LDLRDHIRSVPDFPRKGIVFKDITTLVKNPEAFNAAIDSLYEKYRGREVQKVAGIESRGFVFAAPLALKLGAGLVLIRKPGKLPAAILRQEYALEYGKDAVEIHRDSISGGEKVLMVDDLLATGGTMAAACRLIEALGGTIAGIAFLIELSFLNGRKALDKYEVHSLIQYPGE
jgi:adenine phosphoribosyltransferase